MRIAMDEDEGREKAEDDEDAETVEADEVEGAKETVSQSAWLGRQRGFELATWPTPLPGRNQTIAGPQNGSPRFR